MEQHDRRAKRDPRMSVALGPLISVTIPTMNSAKTIGQCLESIRQQTHRNVEVIVMDGGSTDDTVEIARSAGARVYFGNHLSQRRLLGIRESRGKYVLVLDSDQVLDSATLETCWKTCNDSGCDALLLPEVPLAVTSYVQKAIALDRYLIYHYEDAHPIFGTGLARFFDRDFLMRISWPEDVNANDHAWIHYACWKAGGKIGFANTFLFHHDPRTMTEYSRKFYYWGYHYTKEVRTNIPSKLSHALPRRVYISRLALRNPLIFGLAILYITKVTSAGLGGGKYLFERLWSKIKRLPDATRMFSLR